MMLFSYVYSRPLNFCTLLALLVHDAGHLQTQVMYEDSRTDMKD